MSRISHRPALARTAPKALVSLAALAVAMPALAQEWESEAQLFRFEEIKPVRADALSIPLTVDVVSGVLEDLGATPTLSGNAEIGLYLEGESNVSWPVIDQDSSVYHSTTPLEESSFIGMSSSMQLTVSVGATVVGNPLYFQVVSEEALFEDEVERFIPFLLPYQAGEAGMILQPQAKSGKFEFPVTVPVLSEGFLGASIGIKIFADPVSEGTVYGSSLDTIVTQPSGFVDTFSTDGSDQASDLTFQNVIELYEQTDELELTNQWIADIGTRLGYLVGVDFTIEITVFGFTIPFSFNLWQQQFDVFPYTETQETFEAHEETAPYFHPLPVIELARDKVEFADITVGDSKVFKFGVIDAGLLDLEGTVSIEDDGSGAFAFAPPELAIAPGDQQGVNITFSPNRKGEFRAKLIIESNDPAEPRVEVPIVGNAVVEDGKDGNLDTSDNPLYNTPGGSSIYETCGCASTTLSPSGLAPFAVVPFLVGFRRRRNG